jgi:hypothetical protein
VGAYETTRAALRAFTDEARAALQVAVEEPRLLQGEDQPWRIGLRAPAAQLWLDEPGAREKALVHAEEFSLGYEGDSAGEWAGGVARRLTPERQRALGLAIDRLRSATALRPPEELPLEDHLHELGEEGPLLEPLAQAYREHYGESIALVRWPSGPPSLLFPDVVPRQSLFLHGSSHLARDVRFTAYLRDLGYGMRGGKLRLVPTPAAFVARREALGLAERGFEPRLRWARSPVLSSRVWLRSIGEGVFPINLRGALAYRLTRPTRELGRRLHREVATMWHTHFHALGHDMSLHVFGMHRLAPRHTRRLTEGAADAARSLDPRRPVTVAGYFEGDLTRHCVQVWNRIRTPEAFERGVDDGLPSPP